MHRGHFCSTSAHSSGIPSFWNFSVYENRFCRVSSRRARCMVLSRTGPSRACRLVVLSVTNKARWSVTGASLGARPNVHTVMRRSCYSAPAPISCTAIMDLVRWVNGDVSETSKGLIMDSQVAYRVGSQGMPVYALEGSSKRDCTASSLLSN